MKRIKYIRPIVILLLAVFFQSCNGFLDVNENPNAPVSENLKLEAKLPAALLATVNQESGQLNLLGAFWGGYWGTTAEGANLYFHQKNYNGPGLRDVRDGYPVWETSYTNLLYYHIIREQAGEEGSLFYLGITKIMQGWHFLRLVDIYNNVPFDEALQGTGNVTPAYEPGSEVYRKSIDLITSGMADIRNAPAGLSPGNADLLFKGNSRLWLRFANTVKLRALLRQSEVAPVSYIQQEIGVIQSEGSGFLSEGENALIQPGYMASTGKMNPLWETYYRNVEGVETALHQDIRPTQYLLDRYMEREDPRVDQLYVAINGTFRGVRFGDPVVNMEQYGRSVTSSFKGPAENSGQPAGIFKSATQASVLMTSSESLFLQAEAAHRGWISQSAEILYQKAIAESMKYLGVSLSDSETYMTHPMVAYQGTLTQLITQKWLALNTISSIEAWSDYRRLGLPEFPNSRSVNNPDVRPNRLMYPETERMTNLENVLAQGSDDILSSRIWWQK
ncbi:starch-binding associating with outer membrane [Bacteroidales bacterium 6E]|nr:starch-binding associating with outer membrane [Bacteroidales bacterium 6E]